MIEQPTTTLLRRYDQAYQRRFGARYPIQYAKDRAIAKRLLGRYSFAQLAGWIDQFLTLDDPFIQQSGYTFGVFSACLSKVITSGTPKPTPLTRFASLGIHREIK